MRLPSESRPINFEIPACEEPHISWNFIALPQNYNIARYYSMNIQCLKLSLSFYD